MLPRDEFFVVSAFTTSILAAERVRRFIPKEDQSLLMLAAFRAKDDRRRLRTDNSITPSKPVKPCPQLIATQSVGVPSQAQYLNRRC